MAEKKIDPQSEKWDKEMYPGAVLLSDHIEWWRKRNFLIVKDPWFEKSHDDNYKDVGDTFDGEQLDRAKYNVRLGITFFQDNKFQKLNNDNNSSITIKPYELIFVESYEVFKMPPNIIAHYDLRIKNCLSGLGLQTGLHLDPTYWGRFFCPLFNFSNTPVKLKFKEQLASIRFIYTTKPTNQTKNYGKNNRNELFCLDKALPDFPARSGLDELQNTIKITQEATNIIQTRIENMIRTNFSAMAFIIGALAVVVSTVSIAVTRNVSGAEITLAIGACIIILVIGLLILFLNKRDNKKNNISK